VTWSRLAKSLEVSENSVEKQRAAHPPTQRRVQEHCVPLLFGAEMCFVPKIKNETGFFLDEQRFSFDHLKY
jgi:hypothetical protein